MTRILKASAFAAFLILVDVEVDHAGSEFVGLGRLAKSGVKTLLLKKRDNPVVTEDEDENVTEC